MTLTLFQNTFLVDAAPYIGAEPVWASATTSGKELALINATLALNEAAWSGYAVSASQPLSWPRAAFTFHDPSLGLSVTTDAVSVPLRLGRATAQLALHFIRYPQVTDGYEADYEEITLGPITLKNTNPANNPGVIPKIPASVQALIMPLLYNTSTASVWWRAN